jgi:transposase
MKHYIGLDVSMKETSICVVDEAGKIIYEGIEVSDPIKLSEHIQALKVDIEKAAVESGSISRWLVTQMQNLGIPVICVDARHMAAILSLNVNKTDRNDAQGIAHALRAGLYREVHLKTQAHVDVCSLITARKALVNQRTKLKNVIRGLLKGYGLRLSTTGTKSFSEKVLQSVEGLPFAAQLAIEGVLNGFQALDEQVSKLEKQIKIEAQNDPDVCLLMTVPGVGPITALSFKAAIGDPARFQDSRFVGAYLGMTPSQYSSGETQKLGRISKRGTGAIRSLLYEAAVVMLTRTKLWSRPKAWALKILRKKGMKKAAVALGRKLAVIMHRMLITQQAFKLGDPAEEKNQPVNKVA